MTYHVAIDIGASSGRVILANREDKLEISEIHRFKNGFTKNNGHERWNINHLIDEILLGLEKIKACGVKTCTIGIDTWAVDYVLLDENGELLAEPVAYRDARTQGMMQKVFEKISKNNVYQKTGIQFLKVTNGSTTQYLNIHSRDYDKELLDVAGVDLDKFPDLIETGEIIGNLSSELYATYDLPEAKVVAVATHDTASAVVGVPATGENWAYLSSGTWSLIGVENQEPILSQKAFEENYTNEWGAYKTYRFLKNITGMWTVQEIARMLDYRYTFAEMAEQAYQVEPFLQYVNLNDDRFINPNNMITEIQDYCRESGQIVPETVGELIMCVYSNLALAYAHEWTILENLIGHKLDVLHIVGGGSNVKLLNQLTADVIGKPVIAGPGEATAFGNIMVQMITSGELQDLKEARLWLSEHQSLECYEPRPIADRDHLEIYKKTVFNK